MVRLFCPSFGILSMVLRGPFSKDNLKWTFHGCVRVIAFDTLHKSMNTVSVSFLFRIDSLPG